MLQWGHNFTVAEIRIGKDYTQQYVTKLQWGHNFTVAEMSLPDYHYSTLA